MLNHMYPQTRKSFIEVLFLAGFLTSKGIGICLMENHHFSFKNIAIVAALVARGLGGPIQGMRL